jgi:hypothetical protein
VTGHEPLGKPLAAGELQVLALIADGLSDAATVAQLDVSVVVPSAPVPKPAGRYGPQVPPQDPEGYDKGQEPPVWHQAASSPALGPQRGCAAVTVSGVL